MEEKILIKSVLEGYHFIDKVVKKLDFDVVSKSVNSHSAYGYNETINLACDILHLTDRKQKLLFLKSMVENGIKSMNTESAKILTLKYVDCFSCADISKMLNYGYKKVLRLVERAIAELTLYFYGKGFNKAKMLSFLSSEIWLLGIYQNHLKIVRKVHQNPQLVYI